MGGPLEGIRVIEWGAFQQGPAATAMLGDLGAEVIKIEDRVGGDPARGVALAIARQFNMPSSRDFYFDVMNRNKRSITLDLKKESGKQILYELVKKSDVFLQNFRIGVPERMGLDYKTLSKYNPRLIYASGSGLGPEGPDREKPVLDYIGLGRSGIMTAAGEEGMSPQMIAGFIGDQMGAIFTAYGVLAAIVARERLGIGQQVDTSLLGGMAALQQLNLAAALTFGKSLPRHTRTEVRNPIYNHYLCKDNKWIVLGMAQEGRHWPVFCQLIGMKHLKDDPKFVNAEARAQNSKELISIFDNLFATKTRQEWMNILSQGEDLIYGPLNDMTDVAKDPQLIANDYIVEYDHPSLGKIKLPGFPIRLSQTPLSIRRETPQFGQHTEEVLTDVLGYDWEKITMLKDQEVI